MKKRNNCITIISESRDVKRINIYKKKESVSLVASYFKDLKGVGERIVPLSRFSKSEQSSRSNRLSENARSFFQEFYECYRRDSRLR